jgi:hypothetical protein
MPRRRPGYAAERVSLLTQTLLLTRHSLRSLRRESKDWLKLAALLAGQPLLARRRPRPAAIIPVPAVDVAELDTKFRELNKRIHAEAKANSRSQRLHALHAECRAIQRELATAFGARYGWKLSEASFELDKLACRRPDDEDDWWNLRSWRRGHDFNCTDHPYFYREPQHPWRPAAIAAHLYEWPSKRDQVAELARRLGIAAEPISDFVSWWFPPWTTLVLFRRTAMPG